MRILCHSLPTEHPNPRRSPSRLRLPTLPRRNPAHGHRAIQIPRNLAGRMHRMRNLHERMPRGNQHPTTTQRSHRTIQKPLKQRKSSEFERLFLFFINETKEFQRTFIKKNFSENQRQKKSAQQHIKRRYQKIEEQSRSLLVQRVERCPFS